MLFIGESINATRESVADAIKHRNEEEIRTMARLQVDAGAHMLDVNAGRGGEDESEDLQWLVQIVQDEVDVPLSLDSSSPEAIVAASRVHTGVPMINSISGEEEKMKALLDVVGAMDCKVIALCLDSKGIPSTASERVEVAEMLAGRLEDAGVPLENIYVDPVVLSVATDVEAGPTTLETIAQVRERLPEVHVIAAISNVGFGLPQRRVLNRAFAALTVGRGADAILADICDEGVRAGALAAQTLSGRDPYCTNYLKAYRNGTLS